MNRQMRRKLVKESQMSNAELNAHFKRMQSVIESQRTLINRLEQTIRELRGEKPVEELVQ